MVVAGTLSVLTVSPPVFGSTDTAPPAGAVQAVPAMLLISPTTLSSNSARTLNRRPSPPRRRSRVSGVSHALVTDWWTWKRISWVNTADGVTEASVTTALTRKLRRNGGPGTGLATETAPVFASTVTP